MANGDILNQYMRRYNNQSKLEEPKAPEKRMHNCLSDSRYKRKNFQLKSLVPPIASSPKVSAAMRGNKSKDTLPERLLRSALWKTGIKGYRKHLRHLPGCPDITFPRYRIAIFVQGCFWHLCPKCNIPIPKTNTLYWKEKLRRNKERDRRIFKKLKKAGWMPISIWECEVSDSVKRCISKICQIINQNSNDRYVLSLTKD